MSQIKQLFSSLSARFGRVSTAQKIFFVQNLGIMMKAGIPLAEALDALHAQITNSKFKAIILGLRETIEKGNPLHEGLAQHPRVFGNLFINMVKSGEVSGNLEQSLIQIHRQMKKNHQLISKVRGAMIYPIIVLVAMTGLGVGTIIFVVPKLTEIFEEAEATLPLATRILIKVSNLLVENGLLSALIFVGVIFLIWRLLALRAGKHCFETLILKMPIIGPIIKKINIARFARTLGSLLNTEIPILESFQITAQVFKNLHYREALLIGQEQIKKGLSVEESLRDFSQLFPPVVTQMVSVGEKSGALDKILEELANFYEEEVDQIMTRLPSIIEPILILVLGGAVGGMAMAVIMPMYSLAQQI